MKTRKMKIIRWSTILTCLLALVMIMAMTQVVTTNANASTDAYGIRETGHIAISGQVATSIEYVTRELFGYKQIRSIEFLYNFDGSPDFIHVDFEDFGYAIFLSSTFEILEFSHSGSLPFLGGNVRRYYGGPMNHFVRTGMAQLYNLMTFETIFVCPEEAICPFE